MGRRWGPESPGVWLEMLILGPRGESSLSPPLHQKVPAPTEPLEMGEGGALRVDPHVEGTSHTTLHGKVTCAGATSAPAGGGRVSSAHNLNELGARAQGRLQPC